MAKHPLQKTGGIERAKLAASCADTHASWLSNCQGAKALWRQQFLLPRLLVPFFRLGRSDGPGVRAQKMVPSIGNPDVWSVGYLWFRMQLFNKKLNWGFIQGLQTAGSQTKHPTKSGFRGKTKRNTEVHFWARFLPKKSHPFWRQLPCESQSKPGTTMAFPKPSRRINKPHARTHLRLGLSLTNLFWPSTQVFCFWVVPLVAHMESPGLANHLILATGSGTWRLCRCESKPRTTRRIERQPFWQGRINKIVGVRTLDYCKAHPTPTQQNTYYNL